MFDFENLTVYHKAKQFYTMVRSELLNEPQTDRVTNHQLRRSTLSILLNIAEGSGRFTNLDKRRFYIMARGSVFESVAVLETLNEDKLIKKHQYEQFYGLAEELSKMLFVMIKNLEQN